MATPDERRKKLGALGERIAEDYLRRQKYVIRERNFRCSIGEIDLVAVERDTLVLVEVRTRQGSRFGTAKESVATRKQEKLVQLAELYLQSHPTDLPKCRIDVVAVEFAPDGRLLSVELIRNAVEGRGY
ncbi:MAG: YraN family protein [Chloroflexi bacterium]|nr:YraN family protein [Chloroflexota bacterium]